MLERITSLPRQLQISAIAVVVVLLAAVVFMITRSGPGMVVVGTTNSTAQVTDWQLRLQNAKPAITPQMKETGSGMFEVKVPSGAKTEANQAMYIDAKPMVSTAGSCKAPSAFDTSGATAYQTCQDRANIHDMLVDRPDIVDAQVVLTEYTDDSLDSDTDSKAQAVVTITPAPGATLDGRDIADTVSQTVQGLDTSNVVIWTINGSSTTKIWPQDQSSSGGTCDAAETDDIYIRQSAIQSCVEHQIGTAIQGLFPSMKPQVTALVTLAPAASTESVHKLLQGVQTEQSNNKAPDSTATNSSTEPSTSDTSTQTMAGFIERQTVSVVLPNASASQEQAVRDLLSGYDAPKQNLVLDVDTAHVSVPAPVKRPKPPADTMTSTSIPHGSSSLGHLLTIGALLLAAALGCIVFWMWLKQKGLQREQEEYQQAFARERASFALSDSDALARELEQFMGPAPADAQSTQG